MANIDFNFKQNENILEEFWTSYDTSRAPTVTSAPGERARPNGPAHASPTKRATMYQLKHDVPYNMPTQTRCTR